VRMFTRARPFPAPWLLLKRSVNRSITRPC
jgi:hypothetical protein